MRLLFLGPLLLALLAGCGGKPYKVAKVSGRVTLDGKPLAKAYITFVPMATKENIAPGPTAMDITDAEGRYTLTVDKDTPGAVVNKCRIFITTLYGTRPANDEDGGRPQMHLRKLKDRVPEKYNLKTELTFDVPPGGTDQANFNLKSR
jgi:hypothetical protein